MTLDQFRSESLKQITVSKFGGQNKWKDGGYLGECVSLINQYCWRVLNVPAGPWGHAYAWANRFNPNRMYFTEVSTAQAGDIGVSDGPTKDGHIWIYLDRTTILEQNGKKARRVTVNPTYLKTTAILRPIKKQGGEMPITKEQENACAVMATGTYPGKNYNYKFTGTTDIDGMLTFWLSQMPRITKEMEKQEADGSTGIPNVIGSGYNSQFVGKPVVNTYPAMANFWNAQPKATSGSFEAVKETLYRKK